MNTFNALNNLFSFVDAFGGELLTKSKEDEDKHYLYVEAPGAKQEDVDVSYKDNVVNITIKYGEGSLFRTGNYRAAYAVRNIDTETISAELKNGILTVALTKTAEAKPRKIVIS
jgi:HSP20 family protein